MTPKHRQLLDFRVQITVFRMPCCGKVLMFNRRQKLFSWSIYSCRLFNYQLVAVKRSKFLILSVFWELLLIIQVHRRRYRLHLNTYVAGGNDIGLYTLANGFAVIRATPAHIHSNGRMPMLIETVLCEYCD